jgi:type VI protein secretion system component VasK
MGLITGLLTLPLAPVRGVAWTAELLAEEARRQLAEMESPERALAELEAARAAGEIDDATFAQLEGELIEQMLER